MKSAMILFGHGARDARWAQPFERLRDRLQQRLPGVAVRLAFLEFMTPNLPTLAGELVADGVTRVHVVPVFFGQGGHVLRDMPVLMDDLRTAWPGVRFSVAQAVGESDAVLDAIADYCVGGIQS